MVATSVNQSKKLLELGLNPETADMYYFLDPTPAGNIYHLTPIAVDYGIKNLPEYDKGDVPAWSLSALLDLVPEDVQLTSKGHTYQAMTIKHLIHEYYPSAIDAVYNLLCVIYGERVLK